MDFLSEIHFLPSGHFFSKILSLNFVIEIKKRESPYLRRAVGAHGSNRSLQSGNSGRYTPDSGLFQTIFVPKILLFGPQNKIVEISKFETMKRPIWAIELRRQEGF